MIHHMGTIPPGKSQLYFAERMIGHTPPIQRSSWQGTDAPSPAYELRNVVLEFPVQDSICLWRDACQADQPWAEEHFQERVSGNPLNPTPSYVRWPWHSGREIERFIRGGGKFDHTYPERYWPKEAGYAGEGDIRSCWGDLNDVASQLRRDIWTRQAVLPVFFPEDTGALNGQRVPCSLGYHFIRNGPQLDCNYFLRSCDLTRHYLNDIYLTGRLMQWMVEQVQAKDGFPFPGTLTIFISNLHLFTQDKWRYQ